MTNRKFSYSVLYFGMIVFIAFPIVKLVQGVVLEIHVIFLSFTLAIAFGFVATRMVMKDEQERNLNMSVKDKILKIRCPKCNQGRLVELSSPRENLIHNLYKGLVYCKVCDFEMSKDEFDREYRPNG